MRKIAFFVEGHTELLFVERMVSEVAGRHQVAFEEIQIAGGATVPRRVVTLKAEAPSSDQKYYVLIVDCGGDHQVKTRILEEHERLTRDGYVEIIGVRDVRPRFTRAEIPRLQQGLQMYIKTSLAPVTFVLSNMEIEAWFLADVSHYPKISDRLNAQIIASQLGFDPATQNMADRDHPSNDLHLAYSLVGEEYTKSVANRTINFLDFEFVYCELRARVPELDLLSKRLDDFLVAA